MFLKKKEIVEEIKKESFNNSFDLVDCWIKDQENYQVYIFTAVFEDQEELKEKWQPISSDIALHFQGSLQSNIEIWNIYILFIVRGKVSNELRYFVEQNKYSSRKLVVDKRRESISEIDIQEIVNEKLFDLKLNSSECGTKNQESIEDLLRKNNQKIFEVISENKDKPSSLFTKYLEVLE
ncbi:ABC-three component system middle component 1 [Bacillus toyonensis]|uniref:ABC-three component system middle component 1 n=1 Tax=Bacillus toyonensis TaxID=155322 RepID=UPI000BFE570D|nr:ABC-three component system middle component 1 [Bacillus toyonensis]MED3541310.1 hypothetical protein [Bacillus toyonensis]PHF83224.1 hypothetical protein COI46_25710 [Bacillus toyonensis]